MGEWIVSFGPRGSSETRQCYPKYRSFSKSNPSLPMRLASHAVTAGVPARCPAQDGIEAFQTGAPCVHTPLCNLYLLRVTVCMLLDRNQASSASPSPEAPVSLSLLILSPFSVSSSFTSASSSFTSASPFLPLLLPLPFGVLAFLVGVGDPPSSPLAAPRFLLLDFGVFGVVEVMPVPLAPGAASSSGTRLSTSFLI